MHKEQIFHLGVKGIIQNNNEILILKHALLLQKVIKCHVF